MKLWAPMYLLIWITLLQILIILFPIVGSFQTYDLHALVGIVVISLAWYVFLQVRKTSCPERIKRITKASAILSVVQGILGIILYAGIILNIVSSYQDLILFLHAVNALAIITQASSAATAFDMWEEKEFLTASASPNAMI